MEHNQDSEPQVKKKIVNDKDELETCDPNGNEPTSLDDDEAQAKDLERQLEEYKDKYLRSIAEMDNLRRRFERERKDLRDFGHEIVVKDMLVVLDSFEKALAVEEKADDAGFVEGIKLVQKQMLDVLSKNGLEPINAAGEVFDPNVHQAIQRLESADVTDEIVENEFQKGYTLNGRVIRASMVSVKVPGSGSQN